MTRSAKIWAMGAAGLFALAALGIAVFDLGAWAAKPPASDKAETPPPALFPRSEDYDFDPPAPGSYALPALKTAPDGAVLDHTGAELRLAEAVSGKISLVSFVYLMCADGDGCPLALATLFDIYETSAASKRLRDNVQLVSVSFDPERDTPDALESYAYPMLYADDADQRIEWRMLTTRNRRDLAPILRGYGQVVNRSADGETINHLLRMFLVDREGRIRNIYGLGMLDPRLLMTDIETLLMEEAAPVIVKRLALGLAAATWLASAGAASNEDWAEAAANRALGAGAANLGLPPMAHPYDNPPTPEKIALGRKLFFDRRLSMNGTMSCAMCHAPEQGFSSNELRTAVGVEGRSTKRNAPTSLNVGFYEHLFVDGRDPSLETQYVSPLVAHNEMANPSIGRVIALLGRLPDYAGLFEDAFGAGPSLDRVGMALGAYQRSLIAGGSPFDRWRYGGEENAMSPASKHGFDLFAGEAGCAGCHLIGDDHALFTDQEFHDIGYGWRREHLRQNPPGAAMVQVAPGVVYRIPRATIDAVGRPREPDLGRYEVTEDPADLWRFRTPSLRNVAVTAPYMHDGGFSTLREVLAFYNGGGAPHPGQHGAIRSLGLTETQLADLEAFLLSLTSPHIETLIREARTAPPDNW